MKPKIFILLTLLVISIVNAQPPFQNPVGEQTLTLEIPIVEKLVYGENYTVRVHPHNTSNLQILNYSLIDSCIIHFYNPNGEHLIQEDMFQNGNGFEWEFLILSGNFTEMRQQYTTYVYCSVDPTIENRSGFFQYNQILSPDGEDYQLYILLTEVFMILLIIFFFTIVVNNFKGKDFDKMDKRIVERHDGNFLKTFGRSFGYGLMKNSFLWYYLGGWLLLFFIRDLMFRFSSAELFSYLSLVLDIYSFGFIIVIAYFAGMVIKHFEDIKEIIDDINLGVEK